jgi:hypothetical protein
MLTVHVCQILEAFYKPVAAAIGPIAKRIGIILRNPDS